MPRHEECIDPDNGQDAGYEGYGIGYEPSLSIDSQGNLFVTAHKDLRWGGEEPIHLLQLLAATSIHGMLAKTER